MSDLSLCLWPEKACELALKCRRHTEEPGEFWQSYFCPDRPGKDCVYFIEDKEKKSKEKE